MTSKLITFGILAILCGVVYQPSLRIFKALGVGQTYNRIEDYPYTCRKLHHPLLEACEDMVLDSTTRTLYAACATSLGRFGWSPGGNRYNTSARDLNDHFAVLNIDEPGKDGLYGLHELEITGNYKSSTGGKDIDLHGFDIETLPNGDTRFWAINHRPAVDESGSALDATKVGANSTVEVFNLAQGFSELNHVRTIFDDSILTPNNIAATGDGGFIFTNDHGDYKTGMLRPLSFLFCPGSIGHCLSNTTCNIADPTGNFPNGIVKGHDGLYYISQSTVEKITVHSLQKDGTLLKVDEILVGMGVDNLSIDSNGDIFGAGFPKPLQLIQALKDPQNENCPSTVLRIRRLAEGQGKGTYEVTKALEDIEAKVLPCSTIAVHDAKTGKFFLGSVTSPFITVCEKNP